MGVMYTGKGRKGQFRGKKVMLVGYDLFRELYRVWDGRKVIAGVRNVRFNPYVVGKAAHPERNVKWDEDEAEGESESNDVESDVEETGTTPTTSTDETTTHTQENTTQTHDDDEAYDNVDDESQSSSHKGQGEYGGSPGGDSYDQKHTDTRDSFSTKDINPTSTAAPHPTDTTPQTPNKALRHAHALTNASDPQTHHERRAYEESEQPSKGRTWEQSDRITEANIVQESKRIRREAHTQPSRPHTELKRERKAAVVQGLEGVRVRILAREWGDEWAEKTYGVGWESKVREGIVKQKCNPKERLKVRKQPKPSHFVQFEDRLEKMLDSEIVKHKASEGGPYCLPEI